MKSFPVVFPTHVEGSCLIGKVTHIRRKGGAPQYRIAVVGTLRRQYLVGFAPVSPNTRTFHYNEDPQLSIGDVIELANGHCYVHFSELSNDACLVVNNDCNEACINCPQTDRKRNPELKYKNLQLIRLIPKGLRSLALTGGEPTLDIPTLIDLIQKIYKQQPRIHLDILTNGIVFSQYETVEALSKVLKQDRSTFCITLYGDTPSIHDAHTQVPGSFARVNAALHHLASFGYSIELRYLITKLNYDRLPSWIEYAYDNFPFIDHISIMGMEFSGYASQHAQQLYVSPASYIPLLRQAIQKAVIRDIPVFIYNHQVCLLPKELWKFTVSSISDWKRGYHEKCSPCDIIGYCGGFFTTSHPGYVDSQVFPISLDYEREANI